MCKYKLILKNGNPITDKWKGQNVILVEALTDKDNNVCTQCVKDANYQCLDGTSNISCISKINNSIWITQKEYSNIINTNDMLPSIESTIKDCGRDTYACLRDKTAKKAIYTDICQRCGSDYFDTFSFKHNNKLITMFICSFCHTIYYY